MSCKGLAALRLLGVPSETRRIGSHLSRRYSNTSRLIADRLERGGLYLLSSFAKPLPPNCPRREGAAWLDNNKTYRGSTLIIRFVSLVPNQQCRGIEPHHIVVVIENRDHTSVSNQKCPSARSFPMKSFNGEITWCRIPRGWAGYSVKETSGI